jgi:LysM repeat protein
MGYNFGTIWQVAAALLMVSLAACESATPTASPSSVYSPPAALTPYWTPTPSRTPNLPTPLATLAALPLTPAPSATPFTHTVAQGETMLGIALKYGIPLEDLLAANPGVDPQFLSVDTQLVIPLAGQIPETLPTPTPLAVHWSGPVCYRSADGGAWCFVLVQNDQPAGLENLSARIGLFDTQGQNVASQVAIPALNLLPAGRALPLMAYFASPLPETFTARAELLTALAVAAGDARYLAAEVNGLAVQVEAGGLQAAVGGQLWLAGQSPAPALAWVAAVAYDASGQVVGVRKWEASQPCPGLFPTVTPASSPTADAARARHSANQPPAAHGCASIVYRLCADGLQPGAKPSRRCWSKPGLKFGVGRRDLRARREGPAVRSKKNPPPLCPPPPNFVAISHPLALRTG